MAMAGSDGIRDPLRFNLHGQAKLLLSTLPPHDPYATAISNANSTRELLALLSQLLATPAYTLRIAKLFRPILFDLCARWIDKPDVSETEFVALCLLVEVHEELYPCVSTS